MSTPSIFSAIQKLKSLLTREEKRKWCGIVGFALCTSLLEIVTASIIVLFAQVLNSPLLGQQYLSRLGFPDNLSFPRVVLYIAVACGVVYFVKNCISALEVFYQNFSIQKMNYNFKNKLLDRYAQTDYAAYLNRNSALSLQIVAGDAEQAFSKGMVSCAGILSEVTVFSCLILVIIAMNPSLAFVVFGLGALLVLVVTKYVLPQFYRWGRKLQEVSVYAAQNLTQFFHAFKEIMLLGKRRAFVEAYQQHSLKRSKIQAMHNATNALPRMVIEVLFVVLFVIAVACLCVEKETPTHMLGILGGYLYVGFRVMPGLNRIITQLNDFKATIPSIERIYQEFNVITAKEHYVDIPDFEFKESICLKSVFYRYPNTDRAVLSNVDLLIHHGDCVGIVGETGSGKSTLIDVILGLLKVSHGAVLIDDRYPANAYQWHRKIGYVPQSVYLVDDTIEANIAFGEKPDAIDKQALDSAIERAQLGKLIAQLAEGTKTIVGERGVRLSGGERQRIAIARALYCNPSVLIFDEATSALDNETEARLMTIINAISKNCTVIMVAHRLTTLQHCDKIIVMDAGKIKEITSYPLLNALSKERDAYA
jgi:ATP-binding cassette, subfamily B, bacterial PglK